MFSIAYAVEKLARVMVLFDVISVARASRVCTGGRCRFELRTRVHNASSRMERTGLEGASLKPRHLLFVKNSVGG